MHANPCFVDDLPVITENIQKGFQETKKTLNKWITDIQKKLDGDEDDDPVPKPGPSQSQRQDFGPSQSNQLRGIRKSAETNRQSGERYDADPQVLSDDFGHRLELKDDEGLYSAFLPDSPIFPRSPESFSTVPLFAVPPPRPELSPSAAEENSSEHISSHTRPLSVSTTCSWLLETYEKQPEVVEVLKPSEQQPRKGRRGRLRTQTSSEWVELTNLAPPVPTITVTDSTPPPQAGPSTANGNH